MEVITQTEEEDLTDKTFTLEITPIVQHMSQILAGQTWRMGHLVTIPDEINLTGP